MSGCEITEAGRRQSELRTRLALRRLFAAATNYHGLRFSDHAAFTAASGELGAALGEASFALAGAVVVEVTPQDLKVLVGSLSIESAPGDGPVSGKRLRVRIDGNDKLMVRALRLSAEVDSVARCEIEFFP